MKFRATVRDPRTFVGICQACRSIERRCVVKLHSSRVRFFTSTQVTDGMQVWAGCRTESIFSDYQAQSSQPDDAIFCEVADMAQLVQVMRQAERCSSVTLKLARTAARRPAWRVSMHGDTPRLVVSHDVPVRLLAEAEIHRIRAPPLERAVLPLALPGLAELALFVDKVRSTSCDRLTLAARGDGACRLTVTAECVLGSFALQYDAVQRLPRGSGSDTSDADDSDGGGRKRRRVEEMRSATVSVELRRFARFLGIREITPQRVVLHLVDERAVVLSVSASAGTTLVGYMPAVVQ